MSILSEAAGRGGSEHLFPHLPPKSGEARSSRQNMSGMSYLLRRQLCCPPCHLPSLLGLPSCPSVASAVGHWTWLSVPRNKLAGELWPDLSREGTTTGQGGNQWPHASQQVPVMLNDWAGFLCIGSGGTPSRTTLRKGSRASSSAYFLFSRSGF